MNNSNEPQVEDTVSSGGPPDGLEPSGKLVPEDEELARLDSHYEERASLVDWALSDPPKLLCKGWKATRVATPTPTEETI